MRASCGSHHFPLCQRDLRTLGRLRAPEAPEAPEATRTDREPPVDSNGRAGAGSGEGNEEAKKEHDDGGGDMFDLTQDAKELKAGQKRTQNIATTGASTEDWDDEEGYYVAQVRHGVTKHPRRLSQCLGCVWNYLHITPCTTPLKPPEKAAKQTAVLFYDSHNCQENDPKKRSQKKKEQQVIFKVIFKRTLPIVAMADGPPPSQPSAPSSPRSNVSLGPESRLDGDGGDVGDFGQPQPEPQDDVMGDAGDADGDTVPPPLQLEPEALEAPEIELSKPAPKSGSGTAGNVKAPLVAEACLAVCGIPVDATSRELHILFSGCPGYMFCTGVLDGDKPYALVHFCQPEHALHAAKSRKNTSWDASGAKVDFEVRRSEHMGEILRQRGFGPKHPVATPRSTKRAASQPSRSRDRDAEPGVPGNAWNVRPKERIGTPKSMLNPCSVEANMAKARVEAAVKKNKLTELESSIKEAADAGVPQHELSEAQEKMRQHRRRLAVRNAVFAQQRARNRLADAWDALDKSVEPNKRMTFVEQAVKEGEEACLLCAKAAQRMEESRLREAIEVLCKKWVRLVQTKIEEAMRGQNVSALRSALSEGQVVKDSMVKGFGSSETKGGTVPSADGADYKDEAGVELPSTPPKLAGEEPSCFDVEAFDGLLQRGRSALDAEERRSSAETRLSEALDSTSPKCVKSSGKLRELLQESKQCLVDSNLIASAEKRLAAMEGEAAAKWMLITASLRARAGTLASCVSGPEDMKFAIKSAKSMGLSKVQLESALETYDKLEKLQVIFYVLSDALKETDVTQIREVLRRVSATGLVADQSPLLTVYLTRLRHHLERLEKQQQASERVKEAMSTDRHSIILDELPTRIEEAKRSGVRDSNLEGAEEKLRTSRAQVRLEAALACPRELKDAYREALAAGVDQELLSEAAEILEAEELRSRIKEFAASLQLVSLERSLKLWAEKGYNGADIAELEAQLPELRRQLSQCQEELDMAMCQSRRYAKSATNKVKDLKET
eukprot:s1433_g14.t1